MRAAPTAGATTRQSRHRARRRAARRSRHEGSLGAVGDRGRDWAANYHNDALGVGEDERLRLRRVAHDRVVEHAPEQPPRPRPAAAHQSDRLVATTIRSACAGELAASGGWRAAA